MKKIKRVLVTTHNICALEFLNYLNCKVYVVSITDASRLKRLINYPLLMLKVFFYSQLCDVVFADWFRLVAYLTTKASRKPVFVRLHRYELYSNINYLLRANSKKVRCVIAVSDSYKNRVAEKIKNRMPVVTIRNGVDVSKFAFKEKTASPLRICTVSHLVGRKRVTELVENLPDLKLDIGGVGIESTKIQACISNGAKAVLHGRVDLPQFYYEHDVFVLNSSDEGCPQVLLEAMSCGLIPLSFRWHGADEILPQEFIYNTYSELQHKLDTLNSLTAKEILEKKKRIREVVVRNFSLTKNANQFYELWEKNVN